MTGAAAFGALLIEMGIGFPRGVLGDAARALGSAMAAGAAEEELAPLRHATAQAHWDDLRLAMGAALERVAGEGARDVRIAEALEWTLDPSPDNPFAVALADEAGRSLAAVALRNAERLDVLERRLAGGAPPDDDLALAIGAIVVDLIDLEPMDFEDEIGDYLGAGETDGARRELARSTGDDEIREWARDELRMLDGPDAPVASRALQTIASGPPPEDPAEDAVWIATLLALVEQAVELAVVNEHEEGEA